MFSSPRIVILPYALEAFQTPDTLERLVCMRGISIGTQHFIITTGPAITKNATKKRIVFIECNTKNVVGNIHTHPAGEACYYWFPGTRVATSDYVSAMITPYSIDAIYCKGRVVWLDKKTGKQRG